MNHQVVCQKSDSHYYFFIRGLIRSQFHWHQFPTHFEQLAEQQESNSTAVFIDIPGNGKRFKQATPFSIKEMAIDINKQIQSFLAANPTAPNSKLHIVGISMGGMIAAELAVISNIQFASIHIINSSFANLSPFWHRMRLPAVMNLLPNLWRADNREASILKWTSNNPLSTDLVSRWIDEAQRHPLTLRNAFAQLWAASHYFVGKKPSINSFVYCCKADRLVSWKCSERLAQHWQVSLEYEAEAGHDLPMDNPDWLAGKIIQHSQGNIK
jgi:pimeloyl-[acyl-carrier protein] methyl ester esterase